MKRILIPALTALICFAAGCSDDLKPDPQLAQLPYTLKPGTPGSVDETIYGIYQKYGNYILYDFTDNDIIPTWTSHLSIDYAPADISNGTGYVEKTVDVLIDGLYDKYPDDFVKSYFPYKIMLCETLTDRSKATPVVVDTLGNRQSMLVISRVGTAQDAMAQADWDTYVFKVQRALSTVYYRLLPSLPNDFYAYVASGVAVGVNVPVATGTVPSGYGWTANNHRMWSSGFVKSNTNAATNYHRPGLGFDLNDFYLFLTDTDKTEIENRFAYYPKLKERTILLYPYLRDVWKIDLVAMQNKNRPGDKLPADFFDKL